MLKLLEELRIRTKLTFILAEYETLGYVDWIN